MKSRALPYLFNGAVAALCGLSTMAYAESALRSLTLNAIYQQRVDALAAGRAPQVFLGTASAAPNYGFSWMVSLEVKGTQPQAGHYCGGAVIAPSWVLTAAHCVSMPAHAGDGVKVTPLGEDKLQILTGSNVLSQGRQIKSVEKIIIHPEFQIGKDLVPRNDLALVRLADASKLTVLPLAKPDNAKEMLKDGAKVRIFGWGTATFDPTGPVSNNLLFAFERVVDRAKCNAPDIYAGTVNDSMFCAGLGFADACQGDSGGPAVGYVDGHPQLVGIISWGFGCLKKNFPGVYVNATKYAGWIQKTVAGAK